MKFDRKKFFDKYKLEFGELNDYQVAGLERLLWGYETYYGWWDSIPQIANSFAQVGHETAHSFNPVVEGYYLAKNVPMDKRYFQGGYDKVREFQSHLRYFPYYGIGDIQLTWAENYIEQDGLLRKYFPEIVEEYDAAHSVKLNLSKHPEQMLDGKISFCVMTVGMHKGTFREGHTLDRYLSDSRHSRADHNLARQIVNGDRNYRRKFAKETIGNEIADAALKFEKILNYSLLPEDLTPQNVSRQIDRLSVQPVEPEQPAAAPISYSDPSNNDSNIASSSYSDPAQNQQPVAQANSAAAVVAQNNDTSVAAIATQSEPLGDAPDASPRGWIHVQDWKPFVVGWLKRVWKSFGLTNITQFSSFTTLGVKYGGENWWIFVLAGILVFLFLLTVAVAASGVLAWIWYVNRKEINHAHALVAESKRDPQSFNLGLQFDTKTARSLSEIVLGFLNKGALQS